MSDQNEKKNDQDAGETKPAKRKILLDRKVVRHFEVRTSVKTGACNETGIASRCGCPYSDASVPC